MSEEPKSNGRLERWLIPFVIIAFCSVTWWLTTGFEEMPPILKRGIQPSDFPQLILALIIALTTLMTWLDPVRVADAIGSTVWATMGLMAVFAAVTQIDFFLALSVFATGLALIWGERRPAQLATVGIAVPLVVFFLFDRAFEVRFPRGVLTSLWYG